MSAFQTAADRRALAQRFATRAPASLGRVQASARAQQTRPVGCTCGGRCPRCVPGSPTQGQSASPAFLAGATDLGPPNSKSPGLLTETFGRWARYATVSGPTFNPQGVDPFFRWAADFETSLVTGYLVQKIENSWVAQNCDGTAFTGREPTASYWERWYFYAGQNRVPKDKLSNADDRWERGLCGQSTFADPCPPYTQATSGVWAMSAELYVFPGTDLPGFSSTHTGRLDAGDLEYSLTAPTVDLGRPMATRTIAGRWDFCPPNNIHQRVG